MENYLIVDFSEMGLNNWAVLLGRQNIQRIEDRKIREEITRGCTFSPTEGYSVFKAEIGHQCFWLVYNMNFGLRLQPEDYKIILSHFPEFSTYRHIIGVPNAETSSDSFIEQFTEKFGDDVTFVQLAFAGDPQKAMYSPRHNLKIIACHLLTRTSSENTNYPYYIDYRLGMVWFWLLNHYSLIDYLLLEKMIDSFSAEDRIFMLGRRITDNDGFSDMGSRKKYFNVLNQLVSPEKYKLESKLKPHIDFAGMQRVGLSVGLLLSYNSSYFSVIQESWDPKNLREAFTEKTTMAVTFSGPSFIVSNMHHQEVLNSMGIQTLNAFFDGEDTEEKFINFCKFVENSTPEERLTFYQQQRIIQKNNRKIFWDFALSPKHEALQFILH